MEAPANQHSILIVEDDVRTREALKLTLELEGYEVRTASDGVKGMEEITKGNFGVVVLDRSMPFMDGIVVCQKMRQTGDRTPVLFLSAKGELSARVEGLEIGGDDYLPKPFSNEELLARIKALLRRNIEGVGNEILSFADLVINPNTRTVTRADKVLELTKLEFEILEIFVMNRGIVLSRDNLYEKIWGTFPSYRNRTLETHIKNLRKKLESGNLSRLIHTIRGVGYSLKLDA